MNSEVLDHLAEAKIPTGEGFFHLYARAGRPIFILGRNGAGKSALINELAAAWTGRAIYMPGSRPSFFENESLSITPASRRDFNKNLSYYDSIDTRWKSTLGTTRNEKAIHDLLAAETQYKIDAANQIKVEGSESPAIARLQSDNSPLDIVNAVLSQANFSIRLEVQHSELKVRSADSSYSHARMSDGERVALVFAAEVVSAPAGMVFLIDEPELHLHPSIVIALVKALILTRTDCAFVVCTHQLELPMAVPNTEMILTRGCTWSSGDVTSWEIDTINSAAPIPEWLWVDLLGARRKILFIEGDDRSSLDQPLYALLFPEISVSARETCKDVMRAVEGLRSTEASHRITAFGLIDHDGMSTEQVVNFESSGIYPLSIYAVESLIYSFEAQNAIATQQAELLGITSHQLLEDAKKEALDTLKGIGKKEHLASRLAERHLRDKILSEIPSRQQLIALTDDALAISIKSPYPKELERLEKLAVQGDLYGIIDRYPVRESGVLTSIVRALRLNSRDDYERAVLRRVSVDLELRTALKKKLGNLARQLE
ncbi:ATP-binding protein [Diaphorobacter sp. HDW4B]|uniref:AAA family ATPase n=1 Tax=Diaphorobacter sp. HDW4B TaxID=2714925 RepID=UPI00140969F2|nr:AAA family ATPase [Diaphorobacter sp. HDW4B]QIL72478.1 ATP-binding protein [Diaphorobacter sp. HDW4B]